MNEYVFAIVEINNYKWGAILKWQLKPWYLRLFSNYKYAYRPFALSNKVNVIKNDYDNQYSNILI